MRLLQSVLSRLQQTKTPQRKFVTHLLGLLLMLPEHATFRNMSRYSPYHERSFSRWYATELDWVSLNKSAITEVVPSEHDQALVLDASLARSHRQLCLLPQCGADPTKPWFLRLEGHPHGCLSGPTPPGGPDA